MKSIPLLLLALFPFVGFSQTERQIQTKAPISNRSLYKKTYELKDFVFQNGDSSVLDQLPIHEIEAFRSATSRVEVYNEAMNVVVVLYPKRELLPAEGIGTKEDHN